jgi:lactate permease
VFAAAQFTISNYIGPQLTDILSALSAVAALLVLFRLWKPGHLFELGSPESARFTERAGNTESVDPDYSTGEILIAWMPYTLLVVFVLLWGYEPFQHRLNLTSFSIKWPGLHNQILRVPPIAKISTPYGAPYQVNALSAAGTACMFATLGSALLLRMSLRNFGSAMLKVCRQLMLPTLTVAMVLAIAFVMNYCGATATLGLAFASSGSLFPFFSPLLGWLGVFLTGSDTSANALFGNLQVLTASRLGFSPVLMAAANSAGGVMGKMISLQTIAVATAATGMGESSQGKLFRFTLRHSLILAGLIGIEMLLYAYVFRLHS